MQQWTFTKDKRVVNRGTSWMYEDLIWSVPNEDDEGYIVDQESKKVLGIDGENCLGSKVRLQLKENPGSPDQKWERSTTNEKGFFTLRNLKSGLFLNNVQEDEPEFPTIESTSLFLIC